MIILLSPAKKMFTHLAALMGAATTKPVFMQQSMYLAHQLSMMSVAQIAALMKLSPKLAALNYERFQQLAAFNDRTEQYPAGLLFQGDVYQGLNVASWSQQDLMYAQKHVKILSGLYGLLNFLDEIHPYRLEMGTRLLTHAGTTLYDFWGNLITNELNEQLAQHNEPCLINLASQEYAKAISTSLVKCPIITINFYEYKNNSLKIVGIHAKKARGLLTKFIVCNQIDTPEQIKNFDQNGYCFDKASSSNTVFNFIRHAN